MEDGARTRPAGRSPLCGYLHCRPAYLAGLARRERVARGPAGLCGLAAGAAVIAVWLAASRTLCPQGPLLAGDIAALTAAAALAAWMCRLARTQRDRVWHERYRVHRMHARDAARRMRRQEGGGTWQ